MDTSKIYYDIDGNELTIHQMVKKEPVWAAVRIQEGERAIEENAKLKNKYKKLHGAANVYVNQGFGFGHYQDFIKLKRIIDE